MKNLLLILAILFSVSVFAKEGPDWSAPIDGNAIDIFTHSFSGIPIVETTKAYYGVDYVNKTILWSLAKPKGQETFNQAASMVKKTGLGSIGNETEMFEEIASTPFVVVNKNFIDVTTGKVLLGQGDDVFKTIMSYDMVASVYKLLVKVAAADNSTQLYCIDLESRDIDWKVEVEEAKTANLGRLYASTFSPQAINSGSIIYRHEKTLFLIGTDGNIIWKNECNPSAYFLDKDQKYIVSVEQTSGAGAVMSGGLKMFGKTLIGIDVKSGKNIWKEEVKLDSKFTCQFEVGDGRFIAGHRKGINIYDYATGEKVWKKDYETKNIREITIEKDGVKIFHGNKIMLVDFETGKKAWKKEIKFDIDEEDEGSVFSREYPKGTFIMGSSYVGLFNTETGKKIWTMGCSEYSKVAFSNIDNTIAVLDKKKLYLITEDNFTTKPEKIKLYINEPKEISNFEILESGYFISGANEYLKLTKSDLTAEGYNYYEQLKTDRLLKAALTTASIAGGIASTEIHSGNSAGGAFTNLETARAMGNMSDIQQETLARLRKEAQLKGSTLTKDFAYFLKGEKVEGVDNMSIVKVEKSTGLEVDEFRFGSNRKVIFKLDKGTNHLYFVDEGKLQVYNLN